MYLTAEEEKMFNGAYGKPISEAMKILTAIGDINEADRLIPIKSAHIAGLSYKSHGDAGIEYVENLMRAGARARIYTTLNTIGVDVERWQEIGLPQNFASKQLQIARCYESMGCTPFYSCTPYYGSNLPLFGENIAWAESSAVVFANSVLGARCNREGGPTALASALTGLTPEYGLHLDENRSAEFIINVEASISSMHDFGALGSHIGSIVGDRVPLVRGLPRSTSVEDLVAMGAGMASAGSVALFHAEGITPEANSTNTNVTDRGLELITIDSGTIAKAREKLSSLSSGAVDYVAIGCPHASVRQLREIASLLEGKRVHPNVRLWIHTSTSMRTIAERIGYVKAIERAGGCVTCDMCTVLGPPEALGIEHAVTNSSKLAFYAPGSNHMKVAYGDLHACIDAAVQGKWND
jgi:predicted aconitase